MSAYSAIIEWKTHSGRIISMRFRTKVRNLIFIQCYAPNDLADYESKDAFYSNLTNVINNVRRGDIIMLMGDLNAQVGQCNTGRENIMGRHGLGTLTENGELFTEFCTSNNLVIGGTLFNHKRIHKTTWVSPDRNTENQIDHISISRKWRGSLLDVRNKRGADIASDHQLVIAVVRLKIAAINKNKCYQTRRRFFVDKLKDENISARYSADVVKHTNSARQCANEWQSIKHAFTTAAENIIGFKDSKRKCWITDQTWSLINERKLIKDKLNCVRTRTKTILQQRYGEIDRLIKKALETIKEHGARPWRKKPTLPRQHTAPETYTKPRDS